MKITKRCGHCMKEFESEAHHHKIYCTHNCYQKAKVHRRIARDKSNAPPSDYDPRFITVLNFPTKDQLDFASDFVTVDRPVKVIGMKTQYEPQPNRKLVPQMKYDEKEPDTWLLVVDEGEPVDLVKHILGQ